MIVLAFLAAVVAAQAIDPPGGLITDDDYPVAARRAGQQGVAEATLLIDSSGYVADCTVTATSGSADLDAATCAILRERSRYVPARDKKGQAIPWTTTRKVRWALQEEPLTSDGYRMRYVVDPTGQIGACEIELLGKSTFGSKCDADVVRGMAMTYLKKPLDQYSSLSVIMAIEVEGDRHFDRQAGDVTKIIAGAQASVAPDGTVTACTMTETSTFQGRTMDLCVAYLVPGKKSFAADAKGRTRALRASFEFAATPR